jgi:guanylate kinase
MSSDEHPSRGLLLMIVAPSGVGKTSLTRRLIADHPDLHLSISATTRLPRPGEHEGRDYHFVTRDAFKGMMARAEFLETAEVYGNFYGSPRTPIMGALARGDSVAFDIDYHGAVRIREQAAADSVMVYILPPSLGEMKRRLYARSQDNVEVIQERVARAKDEVALWRTFDYVIMNDDFDRAYAELAHIFHAERLRSSRNQWIEPMVASLLEEDI